MTIVADTSATVIPTGTWSIDPVWSALEFEVKKLGLVTDQGPRAGFRRDDPGRRVAFDHRDGRRSTITTFDETRDGHVQSPDFFDTAAVSGAPLRVDLRRDRRRRARSSKGDLTIKGDDKARRAQGQLRRRGRRPVRERPDRHRAGRHRRPHRFRAELERPASRRQVPPAERGRPQGELRGGQGGVTCEVLAISGSLRDGVVQHRSRAGGRELAPEGRVRGSLRRLGVSRRTTRIWMRAALDRRLRRSTSASASKRRTRSLIVTPEYNGSVRGPQERDRLGVGAAPREARSGTRRSRSRVRRRGSTARSGRSRICAGCSGSAGARVIDGELPVSRGADRSSTRRATLTDPLVAERLRTHLAHSSPRRRRCRSRPESRPCTEERRGAARSGPSVTYGDQR